MPIGQILLFAKNINPFFPCKREGHMANERKAA